MQIDHEVHYRKKCKIRQRSRQGSRDLFWEFWDPLYISETPEARNSKFDTQIDHEGLYRTNAKLGKRVRQGVT